MERKQILGLVVIIMFLALLTGLFNLELVQGKKFRKLSDSNCIRLIPQPGARGNIIDRSGEIVVDSKISYDVMILPQDLERTDLVLEKIAKILGVGINELKTTFKKNFISVSIPVTVASNIELKKAIALGEYKAEEPSIIVTPKPLRHYPYGTLACHVIGYVNQIDRWRLTKLEDYGYKTKDIVGFGGIEEKYDYYLRQEEGGLSVEVNHRGKFMRVLGFQAPQNGKDVQLTIDLRLQKIAEEALSQRKGSVILMDPQTGEILALVNYPNFDPSIFINGKPSAISGLFSSSDAPLINRAISASYPPASIFKIVDSVAGLESKKISPFTSFVCQGSTMVGSRSFKCWDTHGPEDIYQGLAHSCDVFFYKTGLLVGAQGMHDFALKMGLGKVTGFELPYEVSGFIPSPLWRKLNKFQSWYDGDTANLSIGQGDCLVTPIQIACLLAAFANGGYQVSPCIVKSVGAIPLAGRKRPSALNLKKSTVEVISKGLRRVVSESKGTANALSALAVSVAGKTGTAQVPKGQTHAWFAGYFPYEKPKFVICVFLENGGPGYSAAMCAKKIIENMSAQGLIL